MSSTTRQIIFWLFIVIGALLLYRVFSTTPRPAESPLPKWIFYAVTIISIAVIAMFLISAVMFLFKRPDSIRLALKNYLAFIAAQDTESNLILIPFKKVVDVIILLLNISTIDVLFQKMKEQRASRKKDIDITIVGLMVGVKAKQNAMAYAFLFLALFVYFYVSRDVTYALDLVVLIIISALILALFINQKILEYRISKGLYGSNEYEAREILRFILSHTDKSNFSDGQGLKEILPTPELESSTDKETIEGAVEA